MNRVKQRFLKLTMRLGPRLRLRIVERPGLSLDADALAALTHDLRAIARTVLPASELAYGVLGGDRERLDRVVVTVLYDAGTNAPLAFNALAPMDVVLAGRATEVLHLGLVMVVPEERGRGLTDLLYGLTCFLLFLRQRCRPLRMSNVTQVPAVFGMVSDVFDDVFPTPERRLDPSFTHRTLARQIMAKHRHVFGVGAAARFDEARSVILDAYTGGSDGLKKTFEDAPKHRHARFNVVCERELDYARGDDFLQIGQINIRALCNYLSRVATPQTAPWLAGRFALFAVQAAVLPALHWFAGDRPLGILRPLKGSNA